MEPLNRRILLISPPFYRLYRDTYSYVGVPLGLAYLAGAIRQETDWQVLVHCGDINLRRRRRKRMSYMYGAGFDNYRKALGDLSAPVWRELESTIRSHRPAVLGISSMSQTFASACNVARLAKNVDRGIQVIVGGPHPTTVAHEVLANKDIDFFVKGEGERAIVQFLQTLEESGDLSQVAGLGFRGPGGVVENPPQDYIQDLDRLCFPHRVLPHTLKDFAKYPLDAFANVFVTRGCPFRCSFCGSHNIWGNTVRFRSPENIVEELRSLQQMGVNHVRFEDDTFGVTRRSLRDICVAIRDGCPGLSWGCEIHAGLIDEETLAWMKAAGCIWISLGIESGSNEILRLIRKQITIEQALEACVLVKRSGFGLSTFFMIGFPQDTGQTIRDTVAAMEASKSDNIVLSIFTPYPGTETYDLCREMGSISGDFDPAQYNHLSPANNFCSAIPNDRFSVIAGNLVRQVERYNAKRRSLKVRLRRSLNWRALRRLPHRVLGNLGVVLPTCERKSDAPA
ncbi:MAG: B12-binding domain-containing radical SAM protein [Pirellulales bacterium]|nr:B12-binding domain-containing radical SAM protein [Pirellulales bacterium]